MKNLSFFFVVILGASLLSGCSLKKDKQAVSLELPQPVAEAPAENTPPAKNSQPAPRDILSFASFDPDYAFHAEIPESWQGEYIPETEAINIFDRNQTGTNNKEKSQIFIRKFTASDFLTLSTVSILERQEEKINGHQAVRYVIEKKPSVADFPHQPSWRNTRHTVLDIRKSTESPTTFYVFAKAPDLSLETFQKFVESLTFWNDSASFLPPITDAKNRMTKKPFGLSVTPETSPVPNDRFSGIHTGSDFETTAEEKDTPVEVFAICGGKILERKVVEGYGGVVTQACEYGPDPITVLYGHLTLAGQFPLAGTWVVPGEVLATLAPAESGLSGGARKHLHLGIYRGANIDVRGYVPEEKMLSRWVDPASLILKK